MNNPLNPMKTISLFLFCLLTLNTYANEVGDWFDKGYAATQVKDYKQAVKWYTKAAEQGHSKAQYMLAVSYDMGRRTSRL